MALMPKFLEKKLAARYGKGSPAIYKIMNKLGYMRGSRETTKGRAAQRKHTQHAARPRSAAREALEKM
jgi:hypothetical protein